MGSVSEVIWGFYCDFMEVWWGAMVLLDVIVFLLGILRCYGGVLWWWGVFMCFMVILKRCYGVFYGVLWCYECFMGILWSFMGNLCVLWWFLRGIMGCFMGILWSFMGFYGVLFGVMGFYKGVMRVFYGDGGVFMVF